MPKPPHPWGIPSLRVSGGDLTPSICSQSIKRWLGNLAMARAAEELRVVFGVPLGPHGWDADGDTATATRPLCSPNPRVCKPGPGAGIFWLVFYINIEAS